MMMTTMQYAWISLAWMLMALLLWSVPAMAVVGAGSPWEVAADTEYECVDADGDEQCDDPPAD